MSVAVSSRTSWVLGSVEKLRVAYSTAPSGVQPTTVAPPSKVRRVGRPPASGIVYTSAGPSYVPVNATVRPSGEMAALVSRPGLVVRRCASPPWIPTVHRSPSAVNTTVSPWMAGKR